MKTPKFLRNEDAIDGIVPIIILVSVAIVIYSILGPGLVAPGLTQMSNTTAVGGTNCGIYGNSSCFNTWSTGTQSMWTATPTLTGLTWLFIPIIIILAMLKYI